jgi:hypothetical protein
MLVQKPGPLFAGEAEVQTAKGSEAAAGHRDGGGHPGHDSPVEQDPATGRLSDLDELLGVLISRVAPTELQVTDVTPASTGGVLVGDHQRILARVLGQPLLRFLVGGDKKGDHHIRRYALRRRCGLAFNPPRPRRRRPPSTTFRRARTCVCLPPAMRGAPRGRSGPSPDGSFG